MPGGLDSPPALLRLAGGRPGGWPSSATGISPAAVGPAASLVVGAWLIRPLVARPLRFVTWVLAALLILADAGILYVTMRTATEATTRAAGFS